MHSASSCHEIIHVLHICIKIAASCQYVQRFLLSEQTGNANSVGIQPAASPAQQAPCCVQLVETAASLLLGAWLACLPPQALHLSSTGMLACGL